jgi:hypothetical protein
MGDMSREPSMEEILSSIRRVIARDEAAIGVAPESDATLPATANGAVGHRFASDMDGEDAGNRREDDVLELTATSLESAASPLPPHLPEAAARSVDMAKPDGSAAAEPSINWRRRHCVRCSNNGSMQTFRQWSNGSSLAKSRGLPAAVSDFGIIGPGIGRMRLIVPVTGSISVPCRSTFRVSPMVATVSPCSKRALRPAAGVDSRG